MKHTLRTGALTLAALLACLLLTACGNTDTDYIGTAAAKQAALEDAGLTAADDVTVTLEEADGQAYYTVSFSSGGTDWTSTVDAQTGVVTASTSSTAAEDAAAEEAPAEEAAAEEPAAAEAEPADAAEQTEAEPADAAEEAATEQAAAAEAAASAGADSAASGTDSGESGITLEQAQAIALAEAGLTEDAVTITKAKLDQEDGQQIYDIEFRTADADYDVEISAVTGDILSYDYEATSAASGTAITADEAKALALAQVPGATESDIREFKTDYDDGRQVYEGSIVYAGMAYEFEIDASTGSLRSWEAEKRS